MADPVEKVALVIPTPLNILNLANENIVDNLRRQQSSDIEFESLYRLAYRIHYNTGELLVTKDLSEEQ
jgi:hypothetical protein